MQRSKASRWKTYRARASGVDAMSISKSSPGFCLNRLVRSYVYALSFDLGGRARPFARIVGGALRIITKLKTACEGSSSEEKLAEKSCRNHDRGWDRIVEIENACGSSIC